MPEVHDTVVIGAGFAGLGMAWQLAANGFDDVVLLERGNEVGGTWRDNVYPGAACDIPSDLYSFSFAQNPEWEHRYGHQPEILEYLKRVSEDWDIRSRIRFGTEVESARWDPGIARWRIRTSTGNFVARVLISGHGPLVEPVWPALPGLRDFAGPLLHSARWAHGALTTGKRVAVIGTGASSIQLVPAIQPGALTMSVFQRSAPWILPRHDHPTSELRRRLFRVAPVLQRANRARVFLSNETRFAAFASRFIGAAAERMSRRYLRSQIADPELRAALEPDYRIGCKRILVDSEWYRALQQDNCELVTSPIARVEPWAIVTEDGHRHPADILVCATGFDATHPRIAEIIHDENGRSLAEAWSEGMSALRGTTVFGFPNLYLLVGPNTALGHNSIVYVIEAQIRYVLGALAFQRETGVRVLEARRDSTDAWNRRLQSRLAGSVWTTGGCTSFYLDEAGRNTTLWPGPALGLGLALRRFHPGEYRRDETGVPVA
jgi:cation diffusion facilitator CzcD-associated flavoprotein CzcO